MGLAARYESYHSLTGGSPRGVSLVYFRTYCSCVSNRGLGSKAAQVPGSRTPSQASRNLCLQ